MTEARTVASSELLKIAPADAGAAEVAGGGKGTRGGGPHGAEVRFMAWGGDTLAFATHEPISFGDDGGDHLKEVLA